MLSAGTTSTGTRADWRARRGSQPASSSSQAPQLATSTICTTQRSPQAEPSHTPSLPVDAFVKNHLIRASNLFSKGRPHWAIADLLRILAAECFVADAASLRTAHAVLNQALPAQRGLFEQIMPARQPRNGDAATPTGGPIPAESVKPSKGEGGVGRSCIYEIKGGSLLFRGEAPCGTAVCKGASAAAIATAAWRSLPEGRIPARTTHGRTYHGPTLRPLPEADARSCAGCQAALAAASKPHAIVIRHASLAEEAAGWTGAMLAAELGGATCHVLSAPRASNRFTYYWGGKGDSMHSGYEATPTVRARGSHDACALSHSHASRSHAVGHRPFQRHTRCMRTPIRMHSMHELQCTKCTTCGAGQLGRHDVRRACIHMRACGAGQLGRHDVRRLPYLCGELGHLPLPADRPHAAGGHWPACRRHRGTRQHAVSPHEIASSCMRRR